MNAQTIPFPLMAKTPKGEKIKGLRLDKEFLDEIEAEGATTGIKSFSERLRYFAKLGLEVNKERRRPRAA